MKKIVKTIILGVSVAFPLILPFLFDKNNSLIVSSLNTDNTQWVHYSKKEASKSSNGIREYWVKCGGTYQFNKPDSSNIKEATEYDESEFTALDPRYIIYVDDSKSIFYSEHNSSYNYSEATALNGYKVSSIPTTLGQETRMEFYKNDLSPMYSAKITRVTRTIGSKDDLLALQTIQNEKDITGGYYVFTSDLDSPNTTIKGRNVDGKTVVPSFSGTIDGRNHNINNPSFWDYRMFGKMINSTVKNLNFTNISIFSTLCFTMEDTTLDNVNFTMANNINSYSNVGMICDVIYGYSKIKNCLIDFKEHYHLHKNGNHKTAPIAATNYTPKDCDLFENTTIRCLSTLNIFLNDYVGRSLRPDCEGLTYVSTFSFIKNGTLNYGIKYLENNPIIFNCATVIKNAIYRMTGKTIYMTTFGSSGIYSKDDPYIILGCQTYPQELYLSTPSESGDYFVKAIGKAIFINAYDDYSYQAATLEFLNKTFGYDSYYKEKNGNPIYTSDVKDKNNVELVPLNIETKSPFKYRRYDSGDGAFLDEFAAGYNCRGYSSDDIFFDVKGIPEDPHLSSDQRFHTTIMLLYPGKYLSSHPKWFLTDAYGKNPGKTNGSYYAYQLCFTAHGDVNEYNAMVEQMVSNIKNEFDSRKQTQANVLNLGIGDSSNYCKCSACNSKTKEYGSISGTVIKFINDVQGKLDAYYGANLIDLCTFAYTSYRTAPIKNGNPTIHSDVPVMIAPIETNFTHPINDDTYNKEAHDMFEQWSLVGPLYSWLYETNFSHYLYPYNSFEAMTKSITYMADKNVELAYVQGQHNLSQYRTGFNQLKVYLKGKFMANPYTADYNVLVNKYFKNYFKEGETEMRTFFNELVTRMNTFDTNSTYKNALYKNGARSVYSNINASVLWDKNQLERWISLCDAAYSKVQDDETKRCILAESIFPKWCLVTSLSNNYSSSTLKERRIAFKKDADSLGLTLTKESYTSDTLASYYSSWGIA